MPPGIVENGRPLAVAYRSSATRRSLSSRKQSSPTMPDGCQKQSASEGILNGGKNLTGGLPKAARSVRECSRCQIGQKGSHEGTLTTGSDHIPGRTAMITVELGRMTSPAGSCDMGTWRDGRVLCFYLCSMILVRCVARDNMVVPHSS